MRAYRTPRSERRPVVLNLPIDLANAEAESPRTTPCYPCRRRPRRAGGGRARRRPCCGPHRPVIIAGRGAVLAGAREPLIRLSGRSARRVRQRDGPRDLPRRSVGAAHLGRVRLAGRVRAARRERPGPRVRCGADPLDDRQRRAHRRRRASCRSTSSRARSATASTSPSSATRATVAAAVDPELAARGHGATGYRTDEVRRAARRPPLARRALRRRLRATATSTRARSIALADLLPSAHRRDRLRALHGLARDVPGRRGPRQAGSS